MVIGPKISTDMFFWHPEMGMFTQEVSSLNGFQPGQLYDDACDLGFQLISSRTGEAMPFYLHETVSNDEGEVLEWVFHSASRDPRLAKLQVCVQND